VKKALFGFFKASLIGLAVGCTISLFKIVTFWVLQGQAMMLESSSLLLRMVYALSALAVITASYYMIKSDERVAGSGVPWLIISVRRGVTYPKWYKSLSLMFINSLLSFYCGLPLGGEGPAAFMGGTLGEGANQITKTPKDSDSVGAAAGAGFMAAFVSPLAGLSFIYEEHLAKLSWKSLLKSVVAIGFALLAVYLIYPQSPIALPIITGFLADQKALLAFIVSLLLCVAAALAVSHAIPLIRRLLHRHQHSFFTHHRLFFFALGIDILIFFVPLLSGSGTKLLAADLPSFALGAIVLLFLARLILFVLGANSSATGGLVVPSLMLGAMAGYLGGSLFGLPSAEYPVIVLSSMICVFALLNKAPLTGLFLGISFGGYLNILKTIGPLLVAILVAYLASRFFLKKSLYESTADSLMRLSPKKLYPSSEAVEDASESDE
jgi:H+/Cl- antiporter ClcA